jgi:hypothetical protein
VTGSLAAVGGVALASVTGGLEGGTGDPVSWTFARACEFRED